MAHNSNSSFLNWWFQGLGILIPKTLKNIFNPEKTRILLQFQDDQNQLAVLWPTRKKNNDIPVEHYSLDNHNDQRTFLNRLEKYNKDSHDVSLSIPANKGLRTVLKLPLSAEEDLSQILEFEIERQTPFRRQDVYSGYELIKKNTASGMLDVELNVIPKKSVDPQLAHLKQMGITPRIVELQNENTKGINVLRNQVDYSEHKTTKRLNITLLVLALALTLVSLALPLKKMNWNLKQTDQEIEISRKEALEINNLKSTWEKSLSKQTFINNKINSRESITIILNELTSIIPDNSWLHRLQIKGNTVRLHGESAAATSLIGIIDQSDYFDDARFHSPVTNNVSTGNDRFQITAKITYRNAVQKDQQILQ